MGKLEYTLRFSSDFCSFGLGVTGSCPVLMFYRPKFCAECGEKIVRADWPIFTSRRFCDLCSSINKGADMIPRAVAAGGILVGLLGIAIGMRPGRVNQPSERALARDFAATRPARDSDESIRTLPSQSPPVQPAELPAKPISQTAAVPTPPIRPVQLPTVAAEEKYLCGAETKKGNPCSRRVKGPKRCYQHEGMPPMLPQNELRIR